MTSYERSPSRVNVYKLSVTFPRHFRVSQYESQPCRLQLCTLLGCLASKLFDPCLTCLQSSVHFSGFRSLLHWLTCLSLAYLKKTGCCLFISSQCFVICNTVCLEKHSFNVIYVTCVFSFQSCSDHYRCLGSWNWRAASVFGHKLRFAKQSRIVHTQVVTCAKKLIINFIFAKLSSKRWWHIVNICIFLMLFILMC